MLLYEHTIPVRLQVYIITWQCTFQVCVLHVHNKYSCLSYVFFFEIFYEMKQNLQIELD